MSTSTDGWPDWTDMTIAWSGREVRTRQIGKESIQSKRAEESLTGVRIKFIWLKTFMVAKFPTTAPPLSSTCREWKSRRRPGKPQPFEALLSKWNRKIVYSYLPNGRIWLADELVPYPKVKGIVPLHRRMENLQINRKLVISQCMRLV